MALCCCSVTQPCLTHEVSDSTERARTHTPSLQNTVLVFAAQRSEWAICAHISLFFGFPSHLGHHRALYSSLRSTIGPHWLVLHSESESVRRSGLSDSLRPHGLQPARLLCPWDSPGKHTGVGCHSLLQGIFPTQGSNPGLLHCRQILHHLSHQGNPSTE